MTAPKPRTTAAKSRTAAASRVPATAPKPQDHQTKKSAAARRAEADGFVTVEQCGLTLKIPVGENIPLDVVLLSRGDEDTLRELGIAAEDREFEATKRLLGAEQWAEFRKKNPTIGDFNEIGRKFEEATGN